MFILGQYYGTDPTIYLNDNTDLPGFMLVVNISFKCLCMFLSLSIDEIDESAEMRMSIPQCFATGRGLGRCSGNQAASWSAAIKKGEKLIKKLLKIKRFA